MIRPLSLTAYRALSARKPPGDLTVAGPRPDRPVAWFHATSDMRAAALLDLADRLRAQRPGMPVLLTFDRRHLTGPRPARHDDMLYEIPLDGDHPGAAAEFLEYWRPAVGLWTGGPLMPNLLFTARSAGVPLILADIDESGLGREGLPWMPDPERAALRMFRRVFALDITTFSRLQRIGIPTRDLQVAPRLQDSLAPPSCAEEDLTETGETLAGRPVWFAAGLCASEAVGVLSAHRQAVRLSHRLLLVITPADGFDPAALQALLGGAGLRHAEWEPGDPIDEFVQVLVAREADSLALWFRLAPLSIMGGTLGAEEEPGIHPFIPAALGSAVLHGSHTGAHAPAYERLAQAGGTQLVRGSTHLSEVALRLIQPEESARMALAGWDVVTEGAWLIDRLSDLVLDFHDAAEMTDAAT
ncbi:3-deoxy-D-manno-octulosonic acid transferase [Marinibacterium profundimaris]|uniref:3-deoxy-D-manno-octulosonic acid transferase n=1 Tax=Marinibacterium profundimaris TaxID=1679460 RepID=UPI0013031421|nr:glycosyltransferase N-terminal domain-containing protein [Marinibacterium profundimaris]